MQNILLVILMGLQKYITKLSPMNCKINEILNVRTIGIYLNYKFRFFSKQKILLNVKGIYMQ